MVTFGIGLVTLWMEGLFKIKATFFKVYTKVVFWINLIFVIHERHIPKHCKISKILLFF